MVSCYHTFCWACINDHTDRLANSVPCGTCMTPITSPWPCPGQGAELVTPHNYGPRPTEVAAVGGGQRRTPWAPSAAMRRAEEGEGSTVFATPEDGANAEIQLTPPLPSPTRSPRRSPAVAPAPAALLRRSRRAAAAGANLQLQRLSQEMNEMDEALDESSQRSSQNLRLAGESSQEVEQTEGTILSQRRGQRTYRRFNENEELEGSEHTYQDVILDFVKSWIEENQVSSLEAVDWRTVCRSIQLAHPSAFEGHTAYNGGRIISRLVQRLVEQYQQGGDRRDQSHAEVRSIVELLTGRQNPTAGVQGGEPPRRTFTTELRVPGVGATHKEWFIQKTKQWMEDKQVTMRDVIWSQLYLDMKAESPGSFVATTTVRTGPRLIKRCVEGSLLGAEGSWLRSPSDGNESVLKQNLRRIHALNEAVPPLRESGRGRLPLAAVLSRQRAVLHMEEDDEAGLSQPVRTQAERSRSRAAGLLRRDEDLLRMETSHLVTPRSMNSRNSAQAAMNSTLAMMREREDQRGEIRRQLGEREERREDREDRREDREDRREERREDREDRREERYHMMIAALMRSPQPQLSQVTITQTRPDGNIVMRTSVESVEQLLRHLRSTFDPDGEKIMLKETLISPPILVFDVSLMKWPASLDVVIENKEIGGSGVAVFMLSPSV